MNFENVKDDPMFDGLSMIKSRKRIALPKTIRTQTLINMCLIIFVVGWAMSLFIYIVIIKNKIKTLEIENKIKQDVYTSRLEERNVIRDNTFFNENYINDAEEKKTKLTDEIAQTKGQQEDKLSHAEGMSETYSNWIDLSKSLEKQVENLQSKAQVNEENYSKLYQENEILSFEMSSKEHIFDNIKHDYQRMTGVDYVYQKESEISFTPLINKDEEQILQNWIKQGSKYTFSLIYRASKDGFSSSRFPSGILYNLLDTYLVLIKTDWENNDIIGGCFNAHYAGNGFKFDNSAFIFNWTNRNIYAVNSPESAWFIGDGFWIAFGQGDISISDNGCHSSFPESYGKGSKNLELTNGNKNFKVKEMELYTVKLIIN